MSDFPPPGAAPPPEPGPRDPWAVSPPGFPPPPGPPGSGSTQSGPSSYPTYRPAPTFGPGGPGGAGGPGIQGMLGAAHKPGAIPLRPLTLGEMYDGAFRIIRFNPKATVGSAVLVSAVSSLLPILVTAVLTWTIGVSFDTSGTQNPSDSELLGTLGSVASLLVGALLQILGLLLVTGMVCHVAAAAAVGRRLTLGQAWAATHGKRWRLIGLSAMLWTATLALIGVFIGIAAVAVAVLDTVAAVLLVIVLVFAMLAALVVFWVRVYYLPVPALMLEPQTGVFAAVGRGYRLTSKAFWRTFGIAFLTVIVANIAGSMISFPFSLGGQLATVAVDPRHALLVLTVTNALTSVVSAAFTAPFSSAVSSLQYLDLRIRKEAYDVELMSQAGITAR